MKRPVSLPSVSLVVTNYNYSQYIENCLNGVMAQTYRPLECIVVDDCSTDNSVEIIREFVNKNENSDISFRLIQQEKNAGQLAGFIRGIKESRGVFIGFVDADDVLLSDYVNLHVQIHLKTSVAMTVSQMIEIDDENQIHTAYSLSSPQEDTEKNLSFKRMAFTEMLERVEKQQFFDGDTKCKLIDIDSNPVGGWYWGPTTSVMFRKKVIELLCHTKAIEKWRYCADNLVANFAHIIGGGCLIYVPLSLYRRHASNGFSDNAVVGNKQYFSLDTTRKIALGRENLHYDLLETIKSGKNDFLEMMCQHGIDEIVYKLFKHSKRKEIFKYKQLLEDICGKDGFRKLDHKLRNKH